MVSNYVHHEIFPLGEDTTPYRQLTSEHVRTRQVDGREILEVDTEALTLLADQAMRGPAAQDSRRSRGLGQRPLCRL